MTATVDKEFVLLKAGCIYWLRQEDRIVRFDFLEADGTQVSTSSELCSRRLALMASCDQVIGLLEKGADPTGFSFDPPRGVFGSSALDALDQGLLWLSARLSEADVTHELGGIGGNCMAAFVPAPDRTLLVLRDEDFPIQADDPDLWRWAVVDGDAEENDTRCLAAGLDIDRLLEVLRADG